ncbi:hypothetical protein M3573_11800 [Bacillus safensis]|uniref:hypothetical protein n=1 Tax=Bacillus safensis TaxID=561879 RepID=UPI00203E43BF|nr:hypothetical protein [Bacillus safensis]MCM3138967.1 hypothetical protein [Bacillus safensis]
MSLKTYISNLAFSVNMIKDLNEEQENKVLTFLTSYGQIEGSIREVEKLDVKSDLNDENFNKKLKNIILEKKLNAFSLAEYIYEAETGMDQNFVIYLDNVKIKQGINEIQVNSFVLSANQIIGIIPGQLSKPI